VTHETSFPTTVKIRGRLFLSIFVPWFLPPIPPSGPLRGLVGIYKYLIDAFYLLKGLP
jgi:hypothetical protein